MQVSQKQTAPGPELAARAVWARGRRQVPLISTRCTGYLEDRLRAPVRPDHSLRGDEATLALRATDRVLNHSSNDRLHRGPQFPGDLVVNAPVYRQEFEFSVPE